MGYKYEVGGIRKIKDKSRKIKYYVKFLIIKFSKLQTPSDRFGTPNSKVNTQIRQAPSFLFLYIFFKGHPFFFSF